MYYAFNWSACCAAAYGPRAEKRPVLIVFDLDGTIADSREISRKSYQRAFELIGYGRIPDELADALCGPDVDEVCRIMRIPKEEQRLFSELLDSSDAELVRTLGRMFPGTSAMLDALAPHAVLAILTNGSQRYCDANIAEFCLSSYISLYSGYVSGVTKAQRIAQWERELGARRVVCVGDRCTDIASARQAGAYAIGVTYGMGSREELRGADCLCDTPAQVAKECLRVIGEV